MEIVCQCKSWSFRNLKQSNNYMFWHPILSLKITTNAKMSCAPLDIHKLKLILVDTHFTKIGKTYVYLVSTRSYNTFWLNIFLERKITQGITIIPYILVTWFQKIKWASVSSQQKDWNFPKILSISHYPFCKDLWPQRT